VDVGRKYLHGQLVEGSTFIQRAAVSAVFTARDPESLAWLTRLGAADEELVKQTIEVLRMQPRPGARELIEAALLSENPGTRLAALDAAAATRDPAMRSAVRASLQRPGDSRMFPQERALERLVASEFPSDREIAAASLGRVDNEWSRLHLDQLKDDENARVRIAAAASLAELGVEAGVGVLLRYVKGDRDDAAQISAGALRRIPPKQILAVARDVLADVDVDAEAAARVVEAVGWAPEIDAADLLRKAVGHTNETMQLQALWAIGWRGLPGEISLAAGQLDSDNAAVRAMAAWAVVFGLDGGFRLPASAS
jgi:HEAT repeat protein